MSRCGLSRLQGGVQLRLAFRRGIGWGLVDQVFSSATNLGLVVFAAHRLGAQGLGTVVIGFSVYLVTLSFQRALISVPLVALSTRSDSQDRRVPTRAALTVVLVLGSVVSGALVAFGQIAPGTAGFSVALFAPWLLPALVQDLWRSILFRDDRGSAATLNDGVWFAVMALTAPRCVDDLERMGRRGLLGTWWSSGCSHRVRAGPPTSGGYSGGLPLGARCMAIRSMAGRPRGGLSGGRAGQRLRACCIARPSGTRGIARGADRVRALKPSLPGAGSAGPSVGDSGTQRFVGARAHACFQARRLARYANARIHGSSRRGSDDGTVRLIRQCLRAIRSRRDSCGSAAVVQRLRRRPRGAAAGGRKRARPLLDSRPLGAIRTARDLDWPPFRWACPGGLGPRGVERPVARCDACRMRGATRASFPTTRRCLGGSSTERRLDAVRSVRVCCECRPATCRLVLDQRHGLR